MYFFSLNNSVRHCLPNALAGVFAIAAAMVILATPLAAQQSCLTNAGPTGFAGSPGDLNCGANSTASGGSASSFGNSASATGGNSSSFGAGSGSLGVGVAGITSIGANSNRNGTPGQYSTAIGAGADPTLAAQSPGDFSVAIGGGSALSPGANSGGVASVAIGLTSNASGDNTVALGTGTVASGDVATAVGNLAQATGARSIAVGGGGSGLEAIANGTTSIAMGSTSRATATSSIAIGTDTTASGANSQAFGSGAQASASQATAVGNAAIAGFTNSTAIGSGATTTRVNQVSVGTAANSYTMAGITSAASLAAQTGPVAFVTTDASGNLATSSFDTSNVASVQSVASLQSQFTSLQSQVTSVQNQVFDNRLEARTGTAIALAAGSMPALLPGRKFALSAGYGNFEGANAFGFGATALIYDGKSYAIVGNIGGAFGLERSSAGGRGAVSLQW